MPRLTKIYTRKGDDGSTALGSRQRVQKDALRVRAYGTVDELNSFIGFALTQNLSPQLEKELPTIQNLLFHLGAELSYSPEEGEEFAIPTILAKHVSALEELIDKLNEELHPLDNFVLPGGSSGAAALQVARAVCRRAERRLVMIAREEQVSPHALAFLNRLSDALFQMARYENKQKGVEEPLWDSHA